jgi:osmotically-inducible protein OsmY
VESSEQRARRFAVATTTPTDKALQDAIIKELEWDPKVDAAHVGVAVKDGAVILSGRVELLGEVGRGPRS